MRWVYLAIVFYLAALAVWDMVWERNFWKRLGAGLVLLLLVLRLLHIQ
ncbi:MAG: hypothetical protein PHI34_10530 [Acidobacteriota bacterium]|nr:hypothetical protein [Acidobacteriota bacterium]